MTDAYICDAIRTPFGATAERSPPSAPTTLAGHPHRRAGRAPTPKSTGAPLTTSSSAAPNQAGEDNRSGRAHGPATRRPAQRSSRRHRQPTCGSSMDAVASRRPRHQERRSRPHHRRRRGIFARALRSRQGRRRILALDAMEDTTIGWRFVNRA